jgi:hypothetical protein
VEVVVRAMNGAEDKEIAKALGVSAERVKQILHSVFLRYGLRSRAELWRLLEVSEVLERAATTSRLALLLSWLFAYLPSVRALIEAEVRLDAEVRIFGDEKVLTQGAADLLWREQAALLQMRGLLRAQLGGPDGGWPTEAAMAALEGMLQLIEGLCDRKRAAITCRLS